jgi:hypothetical protein
MTAKEKAKELVDKFGNIGIYISGQRDLDICINQTSDALETKKQCALIAVDTVLWMASHYATIEYWQEVKQEIQNL